MIGLILLIGAQAVSQNMLAAADEANGAYVQCLFGTARAANGDGLSVTDFEGKLASACVAEEDALVRAGTAVLRAKGTPNAASTARQLANDARQSVLDTYRRTAALRP